MLVGIRFGLYWVPFIIYYFLPSIIILKVQMLAFVSAAFVIYIIIFYKYLAFAVAAGTLARLAGTALNRTS